MDGLITDAALAVIFCIAIPVAACIVMATVADAWGSWEASRRVARGEDVSL